MSKHQQQATQTVGMSKKDSRKAAIFAWVWCGGVILGLTAASASAYVAFKHIDLSPSPANATTVVKKDQAHAPLPQQSMKPRQRTY